MSKRILDTRDLYKRQQELTDLKSTVEAAQEALTEAEEALAAHDTGETAPDDEKYEKEELENAVQLHRLGRGKTSRFSSGERWHDKAKTAQKQ